MIYDARDLPAGAVLRAQVCVIGSGAGGSAAAMAMAEAGLDVLMLEAGGFYSPDDMTQREEQMFPKLYWDSAGRTSADRKVRLHQGKGVGGSTLHNLNLCKRIDPVLLREWHRDRSLGQLPPQKWQDLYTEVEALLQVSAVPADQWNRGNRLLQQACAKLGWRGAGLQHNRSGCVGSGFCEIGCAFDAKNNAAKVLLPRLIAAKGRVLTCAQAVRVVLDGGRVTGVELRAVDPIHGDPAQRLRVEAQAVVLAASATATPALLLRSGIADPSQMTGQTLRIHPAVVAAGEFAEPVRAWQGIPQTFECSEFLRFGGDRGRPGDPRRLWIVPAFGHPMGLATMLPGIGAVHRSAMGRYSHLAVLTAMLHDETRGRVEPDGDLGLRVHYQLTAEDAEELRQGSQKIAELLFAAQAQKVWIPQAEPVQLRSPAELARAHDIDLDFSQLTAVHPMASCPMSDDPLLGPVDSQGRHHSAQGLWIADGSLFPTSIGGPPQLSIYALGLHVGRAVVQAAGRFVDPAARVA